MSGSGNARKEPPAVLGFHLNFALWGFGLGKVREGKSLPTSIWKVSFSQKFSRSLKWITEILPPFLCFVSMGYGVVNFDHAFSLMRQKSGRSQTLGRPERRNRPALCEQLLDPAAEKEQKTRRLFPAGISALTENLFNGRLVRRPG